MMDAIKSRRVKSLSVNTKHFSYVIYCHFHSVACEPDHSWAWKKRSITPGAVVIFYFSEPTDWFCFSNYLNEKHQPRRQGTEITELIKYHIQSKPSGFDQVVCRLSDWLNKTLMDSDARTVQQQQQLHLLFCLTAKIRLNMNPFVFLP